ncbi:MAG: transcriptional regulator [Flavobacteriales bacterium]|jgi:predicted ArsR family transcriptional regulator|nr:transcriptional regulator [Flavobacteriales bacterium]MBP7449382.1 transcriptional regulator [Flavobacteriales bacterium]HOZ41143.1 transcriptional regulator [Flavobacteriales bacterium]
MIEKLNKLFESRVRLGIMAVLAVNEWVDHVQLKELLGVTDGNLASHLTALEEAKYVQVRKRFVGKRPNTSYKATAAGARAFRAHLDAIEQLLPRP